MASGKLAIIGVATGGMGGTRPLVRNSGGRPPEIAIFRDFFSEYLPKFHIFHYFQNKVGEIRGEMGI